MPSTPQRAPFSKPCFLCEHEFLAEWARAALRAPWHTSEICEVCEGILRARAA
jgi:hypothetical protein